MLLESLLFLALLAHMASIVQWRASLSTLRFLQGRGQP